MLVNLEGVKKFLPHRAPFLFVDSIESIQLGEGMTEDKVSSAKDLVGTSVTGHFKVRNELEILRGHFPGNPILPGVVQVEMMAQVAAFVSVPLTSLDLSSKNVSTLLLSVENAKFRKPIVPEMDLVVRARMSKCRGTIGSYECSIEHKGEILSEATVLAKLDIKDKE